MPWCPECERFLSPPTVRADGTCPICGRRVEAAERPRPASGEGRPPVPDDDCPPVPFHLKALAVAAAIYLGWRLIQGIGWVVQHI